MKVRSGFVNELRFTGLFNGTRCFSLGERQMTGQRPFRKDGIGRELLKKIRRLAQRRSCSRARGWCRPAPTASRRAHHDIATQVNNLITATGAVVYDEPVPYDRYVARVELPWYYPYTTRPESSAPETRLHVVLRCGEALFRSSRDAPEVGTPAFGRLPRADSPCRISQRLPSGTG